MLFAMMASAGHLVMPLFCGLLSWMMYMLQTTPETSQHHSSGSLRCACATESGLSSPPGLCEPSLELRTTLCSAAVCDTTEDGVVAAALPLPGSAKRSATTLADAPRSEYALSLLLALSGAGGAHAAAEGGRSPLSAASSMDLKSGNLRSKPCSVGHTSAGKAVQLDVHACCCRTCPLTLHVRGHTWHIDVDEG